VTVPPALLAARREAGTGATIALLLTLGVTCGVLVVPLYDMHLFDRVLASRSMDTLLALSLFCLLGVGLYAALSAIRAMLLAALAERLVARLTPPVIAAALRRAVGGDTRAAGTALRDVQELRHFLSGSAATAPLDLLLAPAILAVLFMLHPGLGWFGLAAALALLAWAAALDATTRPRLAAAQASMEESLGQAGGLLRDRTLADALGMGPAIARRFGTAQAAALAGLGAAVRHAEALGGAARLTRALLQAGVIAFATVLVLRHEASPGALIGANLLLALMLAPLDQFFANWRAALAARLAWRRLSALLAADAPPTPGPAGAPGIALRGAGYTPPEASAPLFSEVVLEVRPGEIVALTGSNGTGKSTLARLAAGVLRPCEGATEAAGTSAIAAAAEGRIGYLPQRPHLLEASVHDTIARFTDAAPERVVAAARAAGLHETIGRLAQGYASHTGPLDPSLSGGQRQRLAFARALFGDPPVLVLDEPDASLDHDGETVMAEALAAARARGAAVLVVTHRRRLLGIADRVLRLEAGRLQPA
jgi:ATP-binding cassette, subfamily C, bacterial